METIYTIIGVLAVLLICIFSGAECQRKGKMKMFVAWMVPLVVTLIWIATLIRWENL